MVQAKKPTSRPSKNAQKPLDRTVEKQRVASAATHNKRRTQTTQGGTSTTSSKKPVKNSTAPLADEEELDSENMSPAPAEVMRKSNRKIRLTEKMMGVLATSKPKVATKAKKPKTKKQVLDNIDSNTGNAEIEHFKHGGHRAKEYSTLPGTLAPQQGGREADLERQNDELRRWLI